MVSVWKQGEYRVHGDAQGYYGIVKSSLWVVFVT